MKTASILFTVLGLMSMPALAQDKTAELAKKLANPLASLISVPIQPNYDENIGPDEDGSVWRINIQPVIPFSLSEDWNLITRTILPVIHQDDVPVAGMGESGIGDALLSLFFSPTKPAFGRLIWGVGPAILLPTASDEMLGTEKWGVGPTAVFLWQEGPWTIGTLVNHVESIAGADESRGYQCNLLAAFPELHYQDQDYDRSEHGVELRLEERGMVCADPLAGAADAEDRSPDHPGGWWCALLGQFA